MRSEESACVLPVIQSCYKHNAETNESVGNEKENDLLFFLLSLSPNSPFLMKKPQLSQEIHSVAELFTPLSKKKRRKQGGKEEAQK